VVSDTDGDFVVVWVSAAQDGSSYGVFAQRYASSGSRLGGEFQVNTYTTNFQEYTAAAMDADGDFVVAWTSLQDGSNRGVFARRFASSGAPAALEFQVNLTTSGAQSHPALAAEQNGDFVVAWQSNAQDGYGYGIFARRFDSAGACPGRRFQVNTYTAKAETVPVASADADGDFVVAWEGNATRRLRRRRLPAALLERRIAGRRRAPRQRLHPRRPGAAGGGDEPGRRLRRDLDQLQPGRLRDRRVRPPLLEHRHARRRAAHQRPHRTEPARAEGRHRRRRPLRRGLDDRGPGRLRLCRVRPALLAHRRSIGGEFQVNSATSLHEIDPAAAIEAGGDFVVAWTTSRQSGFDPGETEIFLHRFAAPLLDVDGDGAAEPLIDGILILRRMFGFSGPALIASAIDLVDCVRCTSGEVEAYLAALGLQLDADGDGELEALTDGILIERHLFGFTGATLIAGAVDTVHCTRCTAPAITAYLAAFGP
jgi:hypothetical protein